MCVALTISGEASIPVADLERMDNDNPHGIGVAYLDRDVGKIKIRKGLTVKELAWLQPDLPRPFLLHFRWATVGPKVPRLAHPFALGHDAFSAELEQWCTAALIHNGGWSGYRSWILPEGIKEHEISDTQVAAYVIGAGHPEVRKDVGWSNAIIKLGSWRGTPIALVTEHGRWENVPGIKGVRASNLNWQTRSRGVVTSYDYHDYHGYMGGGYGKYTPAVWKDGKMVTPGSYEPAQPYKGATVANSTPRPSHSAYEDWERDITPVPSKRTPGVALVSAHAPKRGMAGAPCNVCRRYVCGCPEAPSLPTGALMEGLVSTGVRSGDVKAHEVKPFVSGGEIRGVDGRVFHMSWGRGNRAPIGTPPCGVCSYYSCVCGYSDQTRDMVVSRRVAGLDKDPGAPLIVTAEDASIVERVNRGTLPINALEDLTLTPLNADTPFALVPEEHEEAIAALKSKAATERQRERTVTRHESHKESKARIARNRSERRSIRRKAQLAIDAIKDCPRATAEMILNLAEREIVTRGLSAPPKDDTSKLARMAAVAKRIGALGTKEAANDRGCTAGVCYCPGMEACAQSKRLAAMAEAQADVEIDDRDEVMYRDPVVTAHGRYLHADMERVQRALTEGDYGEDDGAIMTFEAEDTHPISVHGDPEYARGVETWDIGGEGG